MTMLTLATGRRDAAAGLTLTAGLAKEWRDAHSPHNTFDLIDLAADATGVALGAWLIPAAHP